MRRRIYVCPIGKCHYVTADKANFRRHILKAHRINPYAVEPIIKYVEVDDFMAWAKSKKELMWNLDRVLNRAIHLTL